NSLLCGAGWGVTWWCGSCYAAFYGANIGYWSYCPGATDAARLPPPPAATLARWNAEPKSARTLTEQQAYLRRYFAGAPDESENDVTARHEATTYIKAH